MKNEKNQIYIIDGVRTAIGIPFRSLKKLTVAQMSAAVIAELLRRNKIKKGLISEVIMGNAVSAGVGQNFARQAVYLADLPLSVPACTVGSVCGSGLQSVLLAQNTLIAQATDLIIAGGAESASHAPLLVSKDDVELKHKSPIDSLVYDGLWCLMEGKHMGELCEAFAQKNNISREEQDQYALESYKKAYAAKTNGRFAAEIVPVNVSRARVFFEDEHVRKNVTIDKLNDLPPAFKENGTITSGNSSVPCDGAGAVLLADEQTINKNNLTPRARILGSASIAGNPEDVFAAGVAAINECLRQCRLTEKDIDLFEISESFAAQALFTKKSLAIPDEKWNILGGDVALGHPLGAAGTRVLITLTHSLINQNKKTGLCCICFGSGGAIAVAIEKV